EGENDYKDSVTGLEVLSDALRGYLSDDVWGAGGKLMRVAAAPVLSKSRDRIVGALFVGAETGARLAEKWKKNLGVEIAILLRGQVITSTGASAAELERVPDLVSQHAGEIASAKRTRYIPVPVGSDRLLVVAAPFVGAAADQQAYYVLIGKQPAKS